MTSSLRTLLVSGLVIAVTAATATVAFADTLSGDGDSVTPVADPVVHLGEYPPGAIVPVEVAFVLACSGTRHVNPTQQVILNPGAAIVPPGGNISATATSVPPPGPTWPTDGQSCGLNRPPIVSANHSTVTLTAPMVDGKNYEYLQTWTRTLSPAASLDSGTFIGGTAVTFKLDVVSNRPPVLSLPADFTVEGNASGGWTADWTVSATDAEDDPDPTPSCDPAAGLLLTLGTTTVTCTVVDSKGASDGGSFDVTVVDTTGPSLTSVPNALLLVTGDAAGAPLAYDLPTASDIVDPNSSVACSPAPGDVAPVGQSVVTCTAVDASGNTATASFPVTVELWSVDWLDPVPPSGALEVRAGREVPIRMRAWRDGVEVTDGDMGVRVESCDVGTVAATAQLRWSAADRWAGLLTTVGFARGCHAAVLSFEGRVVNSFELIARGAPAPARQPIRGG